LSDIKELNQTATHFMTQELDQNQCNHGRPQKFFPWGNIEILLTFRGC